jgi:hypothetical protein
MLTDSRGCEVACFNSVIKHGHGKSYLRLSRSSITTYPRDDEVDLALLPVTERVCPGHPEVQGGTPRLYILPLASHRQPSWFQVTKRLTFH